MPVTVPPAPLLNITPGTTSATVNPTQAARLAKLAAYCVDYLCGVDPYTAGWVDSAGQTRYVRFPVGAWITPRRDSGLSDIGAPHMVIEALGMTQFDLAFTYTGDRRDGARRDTRIVRLVTVNNIMGPQPQWVESIDFEPYVAPAGTTLPDMQVLLAPFIQSGAVMAARAAPLKAALARGAAPDQA